MDWTELVGFAVASSILLVLQRLFRKGLHRASVGSEVQQELQAEQLGLELEADDTASAMRGTFDGRTVRVVQDWEQTGDSARPRITVSMVVAEPLPAGFRLGAESTSALGRALAGRDIQVGDAEVDERLRVECENPAAALRLLRTPGVGQEAAAFFGAHPSAELSEQILSLSVLAHPESAWIAARMGDMAHLANVLEHAVRGEPIPLSLDSPTQRSPHSGGASDYRRQLRGWLAAGAVGGTLGAVLFGVGFRDLSMAPWGIPATYWSGAGMVLLLAGGIGVVMGPSCPSCGQPPGRTRMGLVLLPKACLHCGRPLT